MKVKLKYLILAGITICLAVACSEKFSIPEPKQEICFSPRVPKAKSFVANSADETFRNKGINVYAGKVDASGNHQRIINGCRFNYSNSTLKWEHNPEDAHEFNHYWSPACTHNFYAIYPYRTPGQDDSYKFLESHPHGVVMNNISTGTDANGNGKCEDIMFGYKSEYFELGMDMDSVRFEMQHACSALSIFIRNASDYKIISVDNLTVTGLNDYADSLKLSENGELIWGNLSDKDTNNFQIISWDNSSVGINTQDLSYYEVFGPVLIIPQDMAKLSNDVVLNFSVKFKDLDDPKVYSIKISDIQISGTSALDAYKYKQGVHYRYNLDITSTKIYCSVSIVDWIEDEMIELN